MLCVGTRTPEGAIVRPMPRIKRLLSEAVCLPHIVQLLLTFDPVLVEKVAVLLSNILEDNVIMPRLYLTGVFFFILMYTGSNVLPVANFLQHTHQRQAYKEGSFLQAMLPPAMVCFLANHPPEEFAKIFLGEFDTPEAIWNSEMR